MKTLYFIELKILEEHENMTMTKHGWSIVKSLFLQKLLWLL